MLLLLLLLRQLRSILGAHAPAKLTAASATWKPRLGERAAAIADKAAHHVGVHRAVARSVFPPSRDVAKPKHAPPPCNKLRLQLSANLWRPLQQDVHVCVLFPHAVVPVERVCESVMWARSNAEFEDGHAGIGLQHCLCYLARAQDRAQRERNAFLQRGHGRPHDEAIAGGHGAGSRLRLRH